MGDETKHKDIIKGNYGPIAYDCYGNEELRGNEQRGDEELREGKKMNAGYLTSGDDSQICWQGVVLLATCRGGGGQLK